MQSEEQFKIKKTKVQKGTNYLEQLKGDSSR